MGRGVGQGSGATHHSRIREHRRAGAQPRFLHEHSDPPLPQDEGGAMTTIGTFRDTGIHTLRDVLTRLETEGAALGHFNVADLTLLKAVFAAAGETQLSVLVGASEGEREFFGVRELAALV